MFGGIASGIMGAASSIYGANKAAKSAKNINSANIAWEREQAQNQVQWRAQDLDKAGFNRILAAGGEGATTHGLSQVQPDTSGYSSAGQLLGQGIETFIKEKLAKSQEELNDATKGKIESETNLNTIHSANLDNQIKTDIKEKEARIAQMNVETRYNEESYNHRLTQQMAQTEKEVAEGRIAIDNVKFLQDYGITKQQALELGRDGIRIIGQMITAKASAAEVAKTAKEILKNKRRMRNSAKREPKIGK